MDEERVTLSLTIEQAARLRELLTEASGEGERVLNMTRERDSLWEEYSPGEIWADVAEARSRSALALEMLSALKAAERRTPIAT